MPKRFSAAAGVTASPFCKAVNSLKVLVFSLIRMFYISCKVAVATA
jgi:hypothetical protein